MVEPFNFVVRPGGMSPAELKAGYDWSYRAFYRWGAILKAASQHRSVSHRVRHAAYSAGWKKFERAWDLVIRIKQLSQMRPLLETILSRHEPRSLADSVSGRTSSEHDSTSVLELIQLKTSGSFVSDGPGT